MYEIWWEGEDWMHVSQDRGQWGGSCEHSNDVRSGPIIGGELLD